MPEKTAEDYFEEDGIRYFRTGDVGQWEADGALRIIDRKCYISSRDFPSRLSHFICDNLIFWQKSVTVIRKKDLCKMRHGEYIALGKIEAILKTCAAVSNIVVYGSGTFIIREIYPHF